MSPSSRNRTPPSPRDPAGDLDERELRRYERHLRLPEVGVEGQEALKRSRILIVGAGGLGCPAALYLAAAGVGHLGIVDPDSVDESNLQRQVLFDCSDISHSKSEQARSRLEGLNPCITIESHPVRLGVSNGPEILADYDIVLDGTDNFATRYLLNDLCIAQDKPLISGALHRFDAQASVFWASRGPCYRCLFPSPPPAHLVPDCAEAGVMGVLPGLVGTLQASEAIKLVLSLGEPLIGRLLVIDALTVSFSDIRIPKDPACLSCGTQRRSFSRNEIAEMRSVCSPSAPDERAWDLEPEEVKARLDGGTPPLLVDVREPWEWSLARLDQARMIPIAELPERRDELDKEAEIVVICKIGERSGWATRHLREAGFSRVYNLRGGLVAWAARIDPSVGNPS